MFNYYFEILFSNKLLLKEKGYFFQLRESVHSRLHKLLIGDYILSQVESVTFESNLKKQLKAFGTSLFHS